jgi:UDP-N-acetylmuramate--alanine ligase
VAVLQPHGYLRVQFMGREFGEALALADVALVLAIHSNRGRPEDFPGISAELIATAVAQARQERTAICVADLDAAENHLRAELRGGDLCVTLGSSDVNELARRLVA